MINSFALLLLTLLHCTHTVLAFNTFGRISKRLLLRRKFNEIKDRLGKSIPQEIMPNDRPEPRVIKMPSLEGIDRDMTNIFTANRRWKAEKEAEDPEFFRKLGSGHSPTYMWIGCADARVPANEIMGEDAGSVFVVRNVANLVVNTDFNLMAALQYAVNVLKIPHIIVCGHYDCGGVRASIENVDHVPPLENWLRNIRDVYRLHRRELDGIRDPEKRHRRLVELNVIEQCINLFKTGAVQRMRVETYKQGFEYTIPRIHACVFDPATGELNRLEVSFSEYIKDLHFIYDLYSVDKDKINIDTVLTDRPHAPEPVGAIAGGEKSSPFDI